MKVCVRFSSANTCGSTLKTQQLTSKRANNIYQVSLTIFSGPKSELPGIEIFLVFSPKASSQGFEDLMPPLELFISKTSFVKVQRM